MHPNPGDHAARADVRSRVAHVILAAAGVLAIAAALSAPTPRVAWANDSAPADTVAPPTRAQPTRPAPAAPPAAPAQPSQPAPAAGPAGAPSAAVPPAPPPGGPAAAPPAAAPPAAAPARAAGDTLNQPVLSGVWVLDDKASQDPRPAFEAVLAEAMAGSQGEGGEGGQGGQGGPGGRGGRGGLGGPRGGDEGEGRGGWGSGRDGHPGGSSAIGDDEAGGGASFGGSAGEDPEKRRAEIAARMSEAWQRLLITHSGSDFEVLDARDQDRAYVLDGKWHDRQAGRGSAHVNARWDGDAIVVTVQQTGRFGMTQTYRLDSQARILNVTLRLQPPSGADRIVKLVYGAPQ